MFDSLYGNYRTRSFADIFPTADDFYSFYSGNGAIPTTITEANCKTVWALIYSRFGNDVIKSSDENRFKFQTMSIIYTYGPTWEKKQTIQTSLRNLTDDEVKQGAIVTNAHGINPSTLLTDADVDEAGVNDYSRQRYKRSPITAYSELYQMLDDSITEQFINRFAGLFRVIAMPDAPLYYVDPNLTDEPQ